MDRISSCRSRSSLIILEDESVIATHRVLPILTLSLLAHLHPRPVLKPLVFWHPEQSDCRSAGSTRRYPSISMRTTTTHIQHLRVFHLASIFPKSLLALFAYESQVEGLHERVISLFGVALCAVEPFLAWP